MDIKFDSYKTFYYVAVTKSFSKAADRLFISQSAVSQSIKHLESQLQTPLFIRQNKKTKLTYEGKILFSHIEPALHLIESGEKKITGIHELEYGEIRIGVSDTICKYYLLPRLEAFHTKYPHIKVKMINRTSLQCVQLLKDGQVDFIITNLPNQYLTKQMNVTTVQSFRDVFVASKHYKEYWNETQTLDILTKLPLIMLEAPTATRFFIDSFLKKEGIEYDPEFLLTSVDLMMEFARKGLGITFVPDYCLLDDDQRLKALDFEVKWPERQLGVVTHEQLQPSFTARHFIEYLKEGDVR